jgi:phosphotransferase system  glucose/maltose/N-acetylglucosamine-specific IIC component
MNTLKLRTRHLIGAALAAVNTALLSVLAFAQSAPNIDIDVNTPSSQGWYGQWYVWAIGVAVFLVVVIALTNRGSRTGA